MKRNWGIIALLCLLCLTLLTSQVYASAAGQPPLKKTPAPASEQGQPGNGGDKEKQNNGNDKSQSNASDKTEKTNNGKSETKDCVEALTAGDQTEKTKCPSNEPEKPEKDKQAYKNLHLHGTLVAVGDNSITVQIGEETQTFTLDADARLKIPTLGNNAQWDKLNKGVNILIKVVQQADDSLLVVAVNVIPSKPERVHNVGVVSSYTPGESITVDGVSYKITADTVLLPDDTEVAAGDKVTIISPRDVTGSELVAKGIVVRQKE